MNSQEEHAQAYLSALPIDLEDMAVSIATATGVTVSDVLIEAARDGLTAIKPRWERLQAKAAN